MRKLLAFCALLIVCHAANSAELFGTVDAISGSAFVVDQSGLSSPVSVGMNIYEGQTINAGAEGEVHLVTEDGGIIALRPDTVFRVDEYKADGSSTDKIFMSLIKGTVRSITGWIGKFDHAAYRITTPTATIGVRGTDHETTVIDKGDGDEPGTYDNVNEGSTVMKTPQGTAEVTPGKFAFSPRGRAIAPFFLAQRPHFLAYRRLKIEERIQSRKEGLRGRLNQMREERINRLKSIRGNRPKQTGENRPYAGAQGRGQSTERRTDLRQRRLDQDQHARRIEFKQGRENNAGGFKARTMRRRELMQKDNSGNEKIQRDPERRHRLRMRRE